MNFVRSFACQKKCHKSRLCEWDVWSVRLSARLVALLLISIKICNSHANQVRSNSVLQPWPWRNGQGVMRFSHWLGRDHGHFVHRCGTCRAETTDISSIGVGPADHLLSRSGECKRATSQPFHYRFHWRSQTELWIVLLRLCFLPFPLPPMSGIQL